MSQHAANLGRAARLIKRLGDIGGPSEFEGVELSDIVTDVLLAQNHAYTQFALNRVYACDIDESAGLAEVVELHEHSKRVPSA